jgi:hypothetical protein
VYSYNNFFFFLATSITYCERVFIALGIQHETRMRRIILSSTAWPSLQGEA